MAAAYGESLHGVGRRARRRSIGSGGTFESPTGLSDVPLRRLRSRGPAADLPSRFSLSSGGRSGTSISDFDGSAAMGELQIERRAPDGSSGSTSSDSFGRARRGSDPGLSSSSASSWPRLSMPDRMVRDARGFRRQRERDPTGVSGYRFGMEGAGGYGSSCVSSSSGLGGMEGYGGFRGGAASTEDWSYGSVSGLGSSGTEYPPYGSLSSLGTSGTESPPWSSVYGSVGHRGGGGYGQRGRVRRRLGPYA
ncbi:hypothetical protein Tdes44962_MAKER00677 [Teratosphaeria destructans]|uniref:Uncharacterized protein n=1 Tax=Teratosphaeria destructans TaxID=418781 RepID=A0A9W7SNP4_9PEZI|nr:hypothetical protein Tdes44962_MAKER00677 [Teratosphaeria destructans]